MTAAGVDREETVWGREVSFSPSLNEKLSPDVMEKMNPVLSMKQNN